MKKELTTREQETLELLVRGYNNEEIAQKLTISIHTAKAHICKIYKKFSVDNRIRATVYAVKYKLVNVDFL